MGAEIILNYITLIIIIITWFIYFRKVSCSKKDTSNIAVLANVAYDDATLKPVAGEVDGGEYEDPDRILRPRSSTSNESTHSSTPEALEYAGMEDTEVTINNY